MAQLAELSGAGVGGVKTDGAKAGGVRKGGVKAGGMKAGGVKTGGVIIGEIAPPALQQRTIVYAESQQDVPLTESPVEQQPSQA